MAKRKTSQKPERFLRRIYGYWYSHDELWAWSIAIIGTIFVWIIGYLIFWISKIPWSTWLVIDLIGRILFRLLVVF